MKNFLELIFVFINYSAEAAFVFLVHDTHPLHLQSSKKKV